MQGISCSTDNTKKILETVIKNMLSKRPQAEVKLLPYTSCKAVSYQFRRHIEVDFNKIFSDSRSGDCAHIKTEIYSEMEYPEGIVLAICGRANIIFNKEQIAINPPEKFGVYPIRIKKGINELIIKTTVEENGKFGFDFAISVYRYPGMWATDYLFSAREMLPGYGGQSGMLISERYREDGGNIDEIISCDPVECGYVFPDNKDFGGVFDFNQLEARGNCAYALTNLNGDIKIIHHSPISVFIDGSRIYSGNDGECCVNAKKPSQLLIKAIKTDKAWGFEAHGECALPFECEYKWLWIDNFEADNLYTPLSPEYEISLNRPYVSYGNKTSFWRFNSLNTYLRPVLDTFFYGQWFYALMVGVSGLRIAQMGLGYETDYFNSYMKLMCDYYDYSKYDKSMFNMPTMLPRSCELDNLDAIGTIGMNMCDFYSDTNYPKAREIITILADAVMNNIPRFADDGTFHRVETMWADDIYMSCPFLVRAGSILGKPEYFDEAVSQIKGYYKRLWMEDKKIFSHIFFPKEGVKSGVAWGRGNGWILLSLTEMLRFIPQDHEAVYQLRKLFVDFCEGIKNVIGKNYIWHQVLDRDDEGSYEETSCTAMFIISFVRGYNMGLLDESYAELAKKAWKALTTYAIDVSGDIYGVCMGSGCSKQPEYYYSIPTAVNDDHGTGIVLMAGTEILKLEKTMEERE